MSAQNAYFRRPSLLCNPKRWKGTRRFRSWTQILGLLLIGLAGAVRSSAAHPPNARASLTVLVRSDSDANSQELSEAQKVAAAIFRKAGVTMRWVPEGDVSKDPNSTSADQDAPNLTRVCVHILSQSLVDHLTLPTDALGWAPGEGADRQRVYVFYDRARELAQRQASAQLSRYRVRCFCIGRILGEVIAHEIGHILLKPPSHSESGIMRPHWDLKDLRDMVYGDLIFTSEQADVIRAEAIRRTDSTNRKSHVGIRPRALRADLGVSQTPE